MIKKKILMGFAVGILANLAGIFLYILLFSELDVATTINHAIQNDYLGKIIALGAALNFLPFFVFLKKDKIYHARGVLLATIVTALITAITYIL